MQHAATRARTVRDCGRGKDSWDHRDRAALEDQPARDPDPEIRLPDGDRARHHQPDSARRVGENVTTRKSTVMSGTERKRSWRLLNPERSRTAERERAQARRSASGGSYWRSET